MHDVVQLVLPVVVVVDVLVEGDALLLERVSAQAANETGVLHVRLERVVVFLQLAEGVDHDAEHDVEHHDHHDHDLGDVVEQARALDRVVDADRHQVVAAAADAVVHVEEQAVRDRVALGLRPVVVVHSAHEVLRLLEPLEGDEREHLDDHDREHEREREHLAVLGDRVDDVLQVLVARHDVLDVEDEEHLGHDRAHERHDDVREPLDEHLVADQRDEVVRGLHYRDRHRDLVPLGLVVALHKFSGVRALELQDGPEFLHVSA